MANTTRTVRLLIWHPLHERGAIVVTAAWPADEGLNVTTPGRHTPQSCLIACPSGSLHSPSFFVQDVIVLKDPFCSGPAGQQRLARPLAHHDCRHHDVRSVRRWIPSVRDCKKDCKELFRCTPLLPMSVSASHTQRPPREIVFCNAERSVTLSSLR